MMLRAIFILTAMIFIALATGSAWAKRGAAAPLEPEIIRGMHDSAACIALHRESDARAALVMDSRSTGFDRALQRLSEKESACLALRGSRGGRTIRTKPFIPMLFASGLAEALLRKNLAGQELGPRIAFNPSRPILAARDAAEYMGLCAVRTAPAEVARLFATKPASPEEAAAIRAIGPILSQCVAAGQQARLTRESIRSLLALSAYRMSTNNMGPGGTAAPPRSGSRR